MARLCPMAWRLQIGLALRRALFHLRHVHRPLCRRSAQGRRLDARVGALRKAWGYETRLLGRYALPAELIYSDGQRHAPARHAWARAGQPRIPAHAHYGVLQLEDLQGKGETN